jgi:hypothetical protein
MHGTMNLKELGSMQLTEKLDWKGLNTCNVRKYFYPIKPLIFYVTVRFLVFCIFKNQENALINTTVT